MHDTEFPRGATINEFCEMFRISKSTYFKYQREGQIRPTQICGRVVILPSELARVSREGIRSTPKRKSAAE